MSYILKDTNDSPIKRGDHEIFGSDLVGVVKSANMKRMTLSIIGSDETTDRQGDIIRVNGWDVSNYLKNPVFLWAHNYSSVPLAATRRLIRKRKPEPQLVFEDIAFPDEKFCREFYPLPFAVLYLYSSRKINASSVGFIPLKWNDIEIDEEDKKRNERIFWYPREFIKQELLELSGCPVPCNPNALQDALAGKSFGKMKGSYVADVILGKEQLELDDNRRDDLITEIDKVKCEFIDEDVPEQVNVPDDIVDNDDDEKIPDDSVDKPMPNFHACRLLLPDKFKKGSFKTRHQKHDGKEYLVVWGRLKSDNSTSDQSYRYSKVSWKKSEAKSHCKSHKGSFEPALEDSCSLGLDDESRVIDKSKNFSLDNDSITTFMNDILNELKNISGSYDKLQDKLDDISAFYNELKFLLVKSSDQVDTNDHKNKLIEEILNQKDVSSDLKSLASELVKRLKKEDGNYG